MIKSKTLPLPQRKHRGRVKTRGIYAEIVLCVVLVAFVLVPLVTMLTRIDKSTISRVFNDRMFFQSLINSITTSLTATIISIVLAYGLAWAISRTNIMFKAIFTVIFTLPMLIPSISHGMGLIILFGNNGIFTHIFGGTSHLYGFVGIVAGSVIYSFPVEFLMFMDILKYEDYTPYEAAEVLGIPKHKQFTSITLPYLRKPLISIVFAVFTMIVTDYGVPLSVGGKLKTLPVLLYENTVGQLDYSAGALIGMFLLIPAVIAFLVDLLNKDKYTKEDWEDLFVLIMKGHYDIHEKNLMTAFLYYNHKYNGKITNIYDVYDSNDEAQLARLHNRISPMEEKAYTRCLKR
jgi:iron(III) transport system permease protein